MTVASTAVSAVKSVPQWNFVPSGRFVPVRVSVAGAARRGQRRGVCREPEVVHRRHGLCAALLDRHIDLPVVRDGQCVDAVFIRFRIEVVIGEFCTAAISGDNAAGRSPVCSVITVLRRSRSLSSLGLEIWYFI